MRPPFDNYGLNNHAVRHTPWKKTLLSTAQGGQPLITLRHTPWKKTLLSTAHGGQPFITPRHTPWKKTLFSTAQGGQPLITLSHPSYHPDNNIQLIKHYEVPVI